MVIRKQKGNKRQTNTKRKNAQVGHQKFCAPWESVTENWAFKLKTLLSESIFLVTRGQLLIKCINVNGTIVVFDDTVEKPFPPFCKKSAQFHLVSAC